MFKVYNDVYDVCRSVNGVNPVNYVKLRLKSGRMEPWTGIAANYVKPVNYVKRRLKSGRMEPWFGIAVNYVNPVNYVKRRL